MRRRIVSLAATLALFAPPALADVSPAALWSHWQSGEGALTATGETAPSGTDGLSVTGATVRIGNLSAEFGEMTLTPEGEGTRVALPETWTVESGDLNATVTAPDATILATGEADNPTYRIEAEDLTAPISGGDQPLSVDAQGLSGELASDGLDLTADSLSVSGESAGDLSAFAARRSDLSVRLEGPLDGLPVLFEGGTPPDMTLTLESASSSQTVTPPEGEGPAISVASGATSDTIEVVSGQATINQSLSDVRVAASGPDVPLPDASLMAEEIALRLVIPAATSEDPAEFALDLDVTDLTAAEQIWQLFDPAAELPREPANLSVAIEGQVLRRSPTEFSPERLALDEFRLDALGASLTGDGAVLFQDAGGDRAYGRPVGSFAFVLTGAMGLLDQLDGLGTISTGNLVGLRMGLGFLTTEGEGPDELRSSVNIGPQGGVSLNGQRVFELP